jgi:1-deoxy-D-xylulose-5-phosphate reductoisomerase
MKRIVILGATGSIGRQALEIVDAYPKEFTVVGLAAHRNAELLMRQATRWRPRRVAIVDDDAADNLAAVLPAGIDLLRGAVGVAELAALPEADLVLNGIVGSAGLDSTLAALRAGKTLALANKESLVVGGKIVLEELEAGAGRLLPVDSEHSALFQCLMGEDSAAVRRLVLTGSGGPFRGRTPEQLERVTVDEALAHPTWNMGPKITVDSATLMNKGLEVIEAHYLFGVEYDQIGVMIHPQSIVHSLVEFVDGSVKAQLGLPDMRLPILLAMTYPARLATALPQLDLAQTGILTFEAPDESAFPALRLAYEVGRQGKTYPAVLNAANEVAVARFLEGAIGFRAITDVIEETLGRHAAVEVTSVEALRDADAWARKHAGEAVRDRGGR